MKTIRSRGMWVALAAGWLCIAGSGRSSLAHPDPANPDLAHPDPIPVIFDTDIGGDVDDVWALAFLLASPELDLKLIVSDSHNTVEKARIIADFLRHAGRDTIPIGIGVKGVETVDPQETWVQAYRGKVHLDGVQAMIDMIMNSERPITLIAVGPVP